MNNKFTITIDARMIDASGIGRYLQSILPDLVSEFRDIILLGNMDKLVKYKKYNSNLQIIPFNSPIYSITEQIKYPQVIPPCDIFFSPHYNIPLLPIKAKKRITTIHDVFHLAFYENLNLSQKLYSKFVINQALKKADKVITVSNFSKKEIIKYTNKKYENKITIIYNGVNTIESRDTDLINKTIEYPFFLSVGNIKPHKNLKRLFEAYGLFIESKKGQDILPKLVVVGKKEGFISGDNIVPLIENNIFLSKHIYFTGWITDEQLNKFYANAIALIFPSYYEGFGFPPLEAMTHGVPCLVSDAASIPEVCNNAALYFNPFNIYDICDKMNQIYKDENLKRSLVQEGKENVSKFSWKKSISEHLQLIKEIKKD